jgi:hypothetical protein
MGIITNGLVAIGAALRKPCSGEVSASKPGIGGSSGSGPIDLFHRILFRKIIL